MAQQSVHSRTKSQDKVAILMSWCAANEITIHPDLEIVLGEPSSAGPTRATRQTKLTAPLVDYSDDEIDDDSDAMSLEIDYDDERRKGSASANDSAIPGMAVFSRSFIESNTTVVQIPPRAVLSYPNVFGSTLTDQARHQIPQWQLSAAGPIAITSGLQQSREVQYPPGAVYERSGEYATSSIGAGRLSLVNTNPINIDESSADAGLALSLALLNELVKEEASRWSGYLQSLPVEEPSLAIFWDDSDLKFDMLDAPGLSGADREHARSDLHRQARRRITGTQLERHLKSPAMQKQMIEIRTFFTRVVEPFLRAQEQKKQRENSQEEMLGECVPLRWVMFRRAYTFVSSRAFWVDAYHGLALVPVADAFNHTEDHHVHLETDWEVCRICGALNLCPHDGDEPNLEHGGEFSSTSSVNPIQHSFDMVCDRAVDTGSEVFNTYNVEPRSHNVDITVGISNVELMCRYGFVLEGNGADRLLFDEEEVRHAPTNHFPAGTPLGDMNEGRAVNAISEIRALFVDAGLVLLENSGVASLEMDAEGAISIKMWTRFANRALFHARANGEDDGNSLNSAMATSLVQGVCACVVGLCERRLRAMGEDQNDDEEEEREGEGLLTVVGRYVRGERALLNAAVQLWRTFWENDLMEVPERSTSC